LNSNTHSQNNRYWCSEIPLVFHECPLHTLKARVQCATSASKIRTTYKLTTTYSLQYQIHF